MHSLKGKKLLILGGGSQHCKLVEAAKNLGVITYVTDYLETAPAKDMADFSYQINVTETDTLYTLCQEEGIDGIASGWFDFIQPHYQRLCEKANLPCYATKEQFDILTKKKGFKEACLAHNVGVPKRILLDMVDSLDEKLPFKVIVKPSNSRGSRGASVCSFKSELVAAIDIAKAASFDGECIVEEFVDAKDAFCVTYMFVNGEAYIEQLSDAYFGDSSVGLDKVAVAYRSPSKRSKEYIQKENNRIVNMLKSLGVKNGPFVAQGFFTEDDVLFFDPGRRFAGGEYERAFKRLTNFDMPEAMVTYALTGAFPKHKEIIDSQAYQLNGKTTIRLQINVRPGVVADEIGFDEIQTFPEVEYIAFYHKPGSKIQATGNTHQRYAHIVVVADNSYLLRNAVEAIYKKIKVLDPDGNNMIISLFDPSLI